MIDTSISGCFINDLLSGNQTTWHHGNEEVYINHLLLWEIIQAITICYYGGSFIATFDYWRLH